MKLNTFIFNGKRFTAEACIDGVLINPSQPKMFYNTPNEDRPASQAKWWNLPFVVTLTIESLDATYANRTDEYAEAARSMWSTGRIKWLDAWPNGTRYDIWCLDGGAWDRPTSWGGFATIEEAVACAKRGGRK